MRFVRQEVDMIEIIKQKLETYSAKTKFEEDNALKEIMQEIALYALWRADFFDHALFQGGTSLRILHQLNRFSEDLDFILDKPNPDFNWKFYVPTLHLVFEEFGIVNEIISKDKMDGNIKKAALKNDSIVNQIDLQFARDNRKKIQIKLEIDINPPEHSGEDYTYLDFPLDHQVRHQDLPSNFALKIHALLCRPHLKGRDWYDFAWYISRRISPNLRHLQSALIQKGPWENQIDLNVTPQWLSENLTEKINNINWQGAKDDVAPLLKSVEVKSLELWGVKFFSNKLQKLIAFYTSETDASMR